MDRNRSPRLPTLDSALPYAPLTSILPFPSRLIPLPQAVPPAEPPSLLSSTEQSSLSHTLHVLNSNLVNSASSSTAALQTLADLNSTVDTSSLPHYVIGVPTAAHLSRDHNTSLAAPASSSTSNSLNPFARMALDSSAIPYALSTTAQLHADNFAAPQPPALSQAPIASYRYPYASHGLQNAHLEHHTPPHSLPKPAVVIYSNQPSPNGLSSYHPPHHPSLAESMTERPSSSDAAQNTSSHHLLSPLVMIPSFPNSSDPSQYHSHPEADQVALIGDTVSPKKRKRDEHRHEHSLVVDQRHLADSAETGFRELLVNIFEAENQVNPNSGLSAPDQSQGYFVVDRDANGPTVALLPAMLASVDSAIAKLVKLRRFAAVPVEQLIHLQRLLLASLRLAFEMDLRPPEPASEDAVDQWISRLETAESSLRASKLLLNIMTAGREEKELYSEEIAADIVANLQHILDTGILPLVERSGSAMSSNGNNTLFESNSGPKSNLMSMLQRCGRVVKLIGDLLLLKDLSESMVTKIEFLATRVVFTENSLSEKESLFGLQRFESFRRHAMDVVARVFLKYPEQRAFILNEVMSSLEKLPITRQSARQFKLPEGKPIQLVSALLMQLVQSSATPKTLDDTQAKSDSKEIKGGTDGSQSDDSEDSTYPSGAKPRAAFKNSETNGQFKNQSAVLTQLDEISAPAAKGAQSNASYVARYLVQRALNSTKTGDQPYRNLLDIFTEDFLHVLNHPEWPAAEILLRALLSSFLGILNEDKSPAPAKNMALDLMGTIGSAISDIRSDVANASQALENSCLSSVDGISAIFEDALSRNDSTLLVQGVEGPYRLVIEFLQRNDVDSIQLQSAKYFYVTQWARSLCGVTTVQDGESSLDLPYQNTRKEDASRWILNWIKGGNVPIANRLLCPPQVSNTLPACANADSGSRSIEEASRSDVRTCHALILLSLPLCRASDRIFHSLVTALGSQQATVRSRSVKSVSLLLEKDPSILKRSSLITQRILQSASDPSPLVRDSALTLVGKCITVNPELKLEATKTLIANAADVSVAVRKRALKLLRDVYLENTQVDVRALIAESILRRLNDIENSISELAAHTMEEIWLAPFQNMPAQTNSTPIQFRKSIQDHVSLIATTLSQGDDIAASLETFFHQTLRSTEKNSSINRDVCKLFVRNLFESIIDNEQEQGALSQKACLQTLTIFAKADPRLFEADQMLTLRPYVDNVSFTLDDLPVYRSTIAIYRRVFPVLPPLQNSFLLGVQESLLNTVSKLGRQELEEVAACLWIIDGVLQNTERLSRLLISVLRNIETAGQGSATSDNDIKRLRKLLMLAGAFGKACDLQKQIASFSSAFPSRPFGSVPSLVVDIVNPLASPERVEIIRETALDSISLVCQAWPENYVKPHIGRTFNSAFESGNSRLLNTVLSGFRAFYLSEDNRTKAELNPDANADGTSAKNRLGTSMTVTHNDGAATSLAQQFLPKILKIALSSRGALALVATDIIASTNRQGLVHPKECGPALVALETSPEAVVAKVAYEEHQSLHSKHESMLEKEYIKAVEQAFDYQRDNWASPGGVDSGLGPKMRAFYEVIKTGSFALRKKLFSNLCTKLVTDASKQEFPEGTGMRVQFSRFVLENLAFFEYNRADELQHLISIIEKLFSTWGDPLSQKIEAMLEIPGADVASDAFAASEHKTDASAISRQVNISRLRILTMESMTLSMLWQTRLFLRRTWNLHTTRPGKSKVGPKDTSRPPTRITNPPVEEHLDKMSQIMAAIADEDSMISHCQAFLSLLAVDNDLRIVSDEEAQDSRYETPPEDALRAGSDMSSVALPGSHSKQSRKGGKVSTPSSTPRKVGRPPSTGKSRKSHKSHHSHSINEIEDDTDMNDESDMPWN